MADGPGARPPGITTGDDGDPERMSSLSLRAFHQIAAQNEKVLASLPVAPPRGEDPLARTLLPSPEARPDERRYDKYLNEGEDIYGLPGVTEGHVRQAFLEMDYDHKGFIGVSELRTLLTFMGERPNDEELDEMIHMLDAEGMGQVGYEEFQQLFAADHPVLAEMRQTAPQEDRTSSKIAQENRLAEKWAKNAHEEKLLLNAVSGFLHVMHAKTNMKNRDKNLPQAKAKAPGQIRARPGGPPRAVPVSPRQAKKDREMRAKLGLRPTDLLPGQSAGMMPGMPGMPPPPFQPGVPPGMPGMGTGMGPGKGGGKGVPPMGMLGMPPGSRGATPSLGGGFQPANRQGPQMSDSVPSGVLNSPHHQVQIENRPRGAIR